MTELNPASSSAARGQVDAFPSISAYGVIGDCRTAALVSADGSIEWLCLPDFDGPPIFSRLLDRDKGGYLALSAPDSTERSRRYLGDTNVLETVFEAPRGRLRVVDFVPVAATGAATLQPERELVRLIEAVDGHPEVELDYAPRPDFGRRPARLAERSGLGWVANEDNPLHLLRTDLAVTPTEDRATLKGREALKAGERRFVSLSFAAREPAVIPGGIDDAAAKLDRTMRWWHGWGQQCTYDGPYKEAVLRSALTLKMLQFCLSGAVVAAPTTSLPEKLGGGRNWDYRFCWLRDAAFTLRAFIDIGFEDEAADFFGWLMHATRLTQPRLQVLYDIYGRTRLTEREVRDFSGYGGSYPVRTGNAAHEQFQTDIYGYVISAAKDFVEHGGELDPVEARRLARLGDSVCKVWREPDNGIWEFRGPLRHNTWSKVMCWSALDDLLSLDEKCVVKVDRDRLEAERDEIQRDICDHGFKQDLNSFVGDFDASYTDATLLLMPRMGFIDAKDPRMVGTYERIRERLSDGPLIHRYESGTDGMSGQEGAFVICSFWAVGYLAQAGRIEEAKERMEQLLSFRNELGLLSEEIAPADGTFLGNFPQAFSHSGMINAALAIAAAEESRA